MSRHRTNSTTSARLRERRAMRSQRIRRQGFTLIEVILAVMLSVGLIGTALWFYKHAGEVRAEISETASDISNRRHLMDRLTADLRGAIALPGQAGSLDGSTDRVVFITATLPGRNVWVPQSLTETPPPAEQDLRQVSYGLAVYEDEQGQTFIAGIDASVQKLLSPKIVEEGTGEEEGGGQVQSALMTSKYLFLRFQYWDGTAWQIEWKNKPAPPVAVEIVIGEIPLAEGEDPLTYPHEMIRRVVFLPAGAPSVEEGTIIQGLGDLP